MLLITCLIYNLIFVNNMYLQFYSNSRHDSFINAVPRVEGKILWQLDINNNKLSNLENRLILTDGKNYFLDALTEIICFSEDGKIKWKRSKWYGSQVVISDNLLFYQSPDRKDDMEAIDYQNNLVINKYPINGIIDESQLVLFQPDRNGLIAQVYYSDIVDTSVPEYIFYQALKKSMGYTWYKKYNNQICPSIPLVNFEKGFALTFSPDQGQIFILGNKSGQSKPDYQFDLPKNFSKIFASSSKEGDIYLAFSEEHFLTLKCLSSAGKEKYSVKVVDDFVLATHVICPPILTPDGFVFLLTKNKIFCTKGEKIIWTKSITDINYAAAFSDNSIIIAAANRIIKFDANGNEKLNYKASENISAPPVLDFEGRILFCTKSSVYLLG